MIRPSRCRSKCVNAALVAHRPAPLPYSTAKDCLRRRQDEEDLPTEAPMGEDMFQDPLPQKDYVWVCVSCWRYHRSS